MAGTKRKRKKFFAKLRPVSLLMVAGVYVLHVLVSLIILSPARYELSSGDLAPETIFAPRTVEDTYTTELMRQAARTNTTPIFSVDSALVESLCSKAEAFFDEVNALRDTAFEMRSETAPLPVEGPNGQMIQPADTRTWYVVLPEADMLALLRKLPVSLTEASLGYALVSADAEDVAALKTIITDTLRNELFAGVGASSLNASREAASRKLQMTTLPTRLKSVGELLYDACYQPTYVENAVETARAREKAAAAVEPSFISRGAVVVEAGDLITAYQLSVLRDLNLISSLGSNTVLPVCVAVLLFCLYALFTLYLAFIQPELFASFSRMLMLLIILSITVLLEWVCYLLDPRILPSMLAVVLCAALLSTETAMAVNTLFALSFGILAAGNGDALLSADAFLSAAGSIAAGVAAVLVLRKTAVRGALIGAGATGGACACAVVLCGAGMLGYPMRTMLVFGACAFLTPFLLSVFCVGLLPVWEHIFDVATHSRLSELLNTNHPLLKRLMVSAPGTYHHSMMAASLAEGAAQTIGANAVLARAASMYHDVGKLRRPSYFSENQHGTNIHDTLPPDESGAIIIAHQRDAEQLLSKHHIPKAVKQIVSEHHGNSLVSYFFHKARKLAEDPALVDERTYRYAGDTPRTKESAIVMLADSCEAAVRSLGEPTREQIADMIHRIVQRCLEDGQFAQCPITLQELTRIEKSFQLTFVGLLHERIRYPGEEESK